MLQNAERKTWRLRAQSSYWSWGFKLSCISSSSYIHNYAITEMNLGGRKVKNPSIRPSDIHLNIHLTGTSSGIMFEADNLTQYWTFRADVSQQDVSVLFFWACQMTWNIFNTFTFTQSFRNLVCGIQVSKSYWLSVKGSTLLPLAIWGWWDVLWSRRPERCCIGPVWGKLQSGYWTGCSFGGQQSEPRCRGAQPERTPPAGRPGYCAARTPGTLLCSGHLDRSWTFALTFSAWGLKESQVRKRKRMMRERLCSCWRSENQTGRTEEQNRRTRRRRLN